MQACPKISIVTPCFNAEKYIRMTVESVLNQTAFSSNLAILDYIIVDGASTDGTLNIVHDIVDNHKLKNCVQIISEPDNGMYDALVKGMKIAKGDIFSYINADDYYNITAVEVVIHIMQKSTVKWLTGYAVTYNEQGHITAITNQYLFRNKFIANGIYGTKLPHIQQESTFWRSELNQFLNFERLGKMKFSGDYYLWFIFSGQTQLFIVETYLGGFRHREGQLSKQIDTYNKEKMDFINKKLSVFDRFYLFHDKILWRIDRFKQIFNCVKNEKGEYVHWIYDNTAKDWIILSKNYILKKIKGKIFSIL
jgi:glycosyltransferase involved in cell wall biosynthesis